MVVQRWPLGPEALGAKAREKAIANVGAEAPTSENILTLALHTFAQSPPKSARRLYLAAAFRWP